MSTTCSSSPSSAIRCLKEPSNRTERMTRSARARLFKTPTRSGALDAEKPPKRASTGPAWAATPAASSSAASSR
ncbi:hypothetical protein D3C72_1844770 [compost metagenome]